jgi:multiple sugar transport system substrate-binding protein
MKKVLVLLLSLAMLLALTACGNKKSSLEGKQVLTVTVNSSASETLLQKKLAEAFKNKMKENGVDVEIVTTTYSSNSYQKDVMTLYNSGKLGDVITCSDTNLSFMAMNEYIMNINDVIKKDKSFDLSAYNSEIINSGKCYDGGLYYMPRSYDQVVCFIDVDFFKAIGMEEDIPKADANGSWDWWTWDEMEKLLTKMRTKITETYGEAQAAYYYPLDANFQWGAVYDAVIKSFGGYTVDIDKMKSGFDSSNKDVYAKSLKAVEFMKGLVSKELVTLDNENAFISTDKRGMFFTTRPNVAACLNTGKELAFAPLPKFTKTQTGLDNGETYVGFGAVGYTINAESENKDLAWEFVKFCASAEGQEIIASAGSSVPTLTSLRTADAKWIQALKDSNGNVIEQSAFLYDGHKKTLAAYARGVDPSNEANIYSEVQRRILSELKKDKPQNVLAGISKAIKTYLK